MIGFKERVDSGLPLRLSWRDVNAGALSDLVNVFVNGVLLDEVASWDVAKSEVTRRARDANGRLILGDDRAPTFETLRGLVEVRWSNRGAA
jgi:hypothetical protein